jgi:hypothetical protein
MKSRLTFLAVGTLLAGAGTGLSQQPTFTKVTTGDIPSDLGIWTRCAWGDFNNDGFLDLFVSNWGDLTNVFYLNNRDGTFKKISLGDPVGDGDYHTGAAAADYDNDGHLDLVVLAGADAPEAHRYSLYHNEGNATFTRVGGGTVTNQLGYFGACAWGDYDNDGFVDLFITDLGANAGGARNLLLHNNGDGTFSKVASGAVANDVGVGYGALWADYDNDGLMDLLVVNNSPNALNFLYHNNGDGTFSRVLTNAVGTNQWPQGASGAAWGDYDNDGFQDLFVTDSAGVQNGLYHNNGDGTFARITSDPTVSPPAGGWSNGCAWGDYDNDGYLDLFVSNWEGQNGLFHNNGDGTFTQILSGDPVTDGGPGIGCNAVSWVDYDNDGFLDLFVTSVPDSLSLGNNLLYHNNGNSNAWLEINCVGTAANRSAIGTRVRVRATIGGKTFWQLREINNGGGWNIVPLTAHFGLGDATTVDTVRIEWPSGIVQTMTNVAPKQILTVVEHQATPPGPISFTRVQTLTNGGVSLSVTGSPGPLYLFEASTNLVSWAKLGVRTNLSGTVEFSDAAAAKFTRRFYRVSVP